MLDFYLQWCLPSWVGNFSEWLWGLRLQKIYGQPKPGTDLKPRLMWLLHIRLAGFLLGISFSHTCRPMNVETPDVATPQQ